MKINKKYFLGANSCEGFVSHFKDCYAAEEGYRAYIIKGGPGTGKSSLMKHIAADAIDKGIKVELCPCSSDPGSLDGVILPEIKTVILDGTAPHTLDPEFPGACEEIINLGDCWDSKILKENAQNIISISAENKLLHKKASLYLSALGEIVKDNRDLELSCTDIKAVKRFADTLGQKYLPKKGYYGSEQIRFITGITPLGVVSYPKTISAFFNKLIIINDKYSGVSSLIAESFRKRALQSGYDIITLKSPFLPAEICEHILVPELSIALVSENSYISFESNERRIHSRRFTDIIKLKIARNRMLFNKKVGKELLSGAVKTLGAAKLSHDRLESYYITAMDFSAVNKKAADIEKKIFE